MKNGLLTIIGFCVAITYLLPHVALADVIERRINSKNMIVHVENESWQPEKFENGMIIPASFVKSPSIIIDGIDDEQDWLNAVEVVVPLGYGTVQAASVKALYTNDEVFIRVRWKDATENRAHHPWIWDEQLSRYVSGPQIEDSILLSIEAGCEWYPSLLGGLIYDFDGWHWMAGRSDPLGQAVDLVGTVQDKLYPDKNPPKYTSRNNVGTWNLKFTDHSVGRFNANWHELDRAYTFRPVSESVYLYMEPDSTRGSGKQEFARQLPAPSIAPADPGVQVPQYQPLRLHGPAGEVAAKGVWADGYWTVEFRRALITPAGIINDSVFSRLSQFSMYVFDAVERIDQASESERLFLRFMETEEFGDDLMIARD